MTDRMPPNPDENKRADGGTEPHIRRVGQDTSESSAHRTRPFAPPPARYDRPNQGQHVAPPGSQRPTQPQQRQAPPRRSTGAMPPVTGQMPPATGQLPPRRPRTQRPPKSPKDSVFYLPWWSVALMLLAVFVAAVGIVAVLIATGGRAPTSNEVAAPIIRVVTAEPNTLAAQPTAPPPPALPADNQTILGGNAPNTLALQGPTLEAVVLTNTPAPLSVGNVVIVDGVGDQELNVRDVPGIVGSTVIFRAAEGTRFNIIDGPRQAEGFNWWQLQDVNNAGRTGWAASNYLRLAPQ